MKSCFYILILFLPVLQAGAQPFVMYPGDTNNDGRADQYDLLPVGVAYGREGFPRPDPVPDWVPQFHPMQWLDNLPVSGVNLGFVDADGNGLIDSLDIDAISLHFDSMQADADPPPMPYLLPDTCFSCPKPDLLVTFDRDTAMVNDTFYATLFLRYDPPVDPALGALGLAFELEYEPENIRDDLTRVFPDTMPGDLMFAAATSTLARTWRGLPPGRIGFGAAGRGQNALFNPRELGKVALVVEDMIIRSFSTEVDFWMDVSGLLIINSAEQVICPGEIILDTLLLFDPLDQTATINLHPDVRLFPNPATTTLNLRSVDARMLEIAIFSITGIPVFYQTGRTESLELPVGQLNTGIYLVKILTENGPVVRKVRIGH